MSLATYFIIFSIHFCWITLGGYQISKPNKKVNMTIPKVLMSAHFLIVLHRQPIPCLAML
jgi:hypothetical protein